MLYQINMSNSICLQTRVLFSWPNKSFWPTKYYNFTWSSTDLSLTTVQWEYKRNWSAFNLICPCQYIFCMSAVLLLLVGISCWLMEPVLKLCLPYILGPPISPTRAWRRWWVYSIHTGDFSARWWRYIGADIQNIKQAK